MLGIPEGELLEGSLPSRQMKLVQAWIELHRDELMADWILAASGQTPTRLIPCVEALAMTPDVVRVRPLAGYQLETGFANGETRLFDMRPYLAYPAFAPIAEGALFMRAHVALGTVAWTDEIDLSPDTLYLRGAPVETVGAQERDGVRSPVPSV